MYTSVIGLIAQISLTTPPTQPYYSALLECESVRMSNVSDTPPGPDNPKVHCIYKKLIPLLLVACGVAVECLLRNLSTLVQVRCILSVTDLLPTTAIILRWGIE